MSSLTWNQPNKNPLGLWEGPKTLFQQGSFFFLSAKCLPNMLYVCYTNQEDIYQWIPNNFAEVSNWHFCMLSFQNWFPPYSAQSQMTQQECSCTLSGQLSLPFLCSLTLFWHYLFLSLLNTFFPFYYILFGLFLTLLPPLSVDISMSSLY